MNVAAKNFWHLTQVASTEGLTSQALPRISAAQRQTMSGGRLSSTRNSAVKMSLSPFPDGGHPPAALISDLDGTLTETELLKARSYARTVMILLEGSGVDQLRLLDEDTAPSSCIKALEQQNDAEGTMRCDAESIRHDIAQRAANAAIESYLSNIGGTTEAVAEGIVKSLHLQEALIPKMEQYGFKEPWQALYKWRKEIYASTFATEANIFDARYQHNVDLLRRASQSGLKVAVATQSLTEDAERVTQILGIDDCLTAVLGREKVHKPKPDPDIYLAAAKELGVKPERCLVLEDSVTGLTAALAAGMKVVAVANPFSKGLLRKQTLLPQEAIVFEPGQLDSVIMRQCEELHSASQA